jgi:hypothetical protein
MAEEKQRNRDLIRRPLRKSAPRLKAYGMKLDPDWALTTSRSGQQRRPETGQSANWTLSFTHSLQGCSDDLRLQRSPSAFSRFEPAGKDQEEVALQSPSR